MARKKDPKPNGRPPIEIDPDQLERLGALQPTVEEVAAFFKCTKRTMIEKLKNDTLKEALERGKQVGRLNLRRIQMRHAQGTGSGAVNMSIHLGKHWLGQTDRSLLELTGKNGKPIEQNITTKMTPAEAAAAYASTLHGDKG
ncbi:hypothetical protein [Bradyrhizobium sp.]|uniref:hypothetical protein n=1 Tax=Bradyrhizobium sp. TaxID=376 RepID=UPI001ECA3CDA|nr:hypothetical protein [Bradyrhizobium sp.]MBV9982275.1 hypothetical protein [Bradyrhizobium sp.]